MASLSSPSDRSDWETAQSGAALVFGLLGKIVFTYPEREWLQPLFEQGVFEEAPFGAEQPEVAAGLKLLDSWSQQYVRVPGSATLEELRSDYTRLFIGPDHLLAAPWESVHRSVDRLLFQEQTLQVREWYRRYGLEAVNLYREPDDHVGLELALLSHIATLAAEAADSRDEAALSRYLEAERSFVAEHPITWVPLWCELVIRQARTDFYVGVAMVIRGTLTEFAALLGVAIPPWKLDEDQER